MTVKANTASVRDSMFRRLKSIGLSPDTVTELDWPKVKKELGWAQNTFKTCLAFTGRIPSKTLAQFQDVRRTYSPTEHETRVLREHLGVFPSVLQYLGCRWSQMWSFEVDSRAGVLRIPPQKGGRLVVVSWGDLTPTARAEIKSWLVEREDTGPKAMRYRWDCLIKRGLISSECIPHSFRHAFVSRSVKSEVPITVVSSLVGHSDPRTTMRYFSTTPEEASGYLNRINQGH